MQERVPAQNIEAEQAVLGAILIDNNVMEKIEEILKPSDFYRIVHQIIYQIMLDLYARHEPVDMVTLTEELKNRNKLDDVGGGSYITLLANIVPTSANALYHARIVVNNALLRQLGESGSLEQDADIVMFLYREDYYKGAEDTPSHITELIVAKHRNGPTGRVTLFFKEDCTKFISLSRRRRK